MSFRKSLDSQRHLATAGAPLPTWWKLGTTVAAAVFAVVLLVTGLRANGTDQVAATQVPAFALGGGAQTFDITTPTAQASPAATQTTQDQASATGVGQFDPSSSPEPGTTPAATPPLTATGLILVTPLTDDGSQTTVSTTLGPTPVARNLVATAMAAMWAEVNQDVAQALPMAPGVATVIPARTLPNAAVTGLRLESGSGTRYTFTATIDPDGAGRKAPHLATHVVELTDRGYVVSR